jgi:multidrug efflux pump subunit AcrA (membrane-fusion protein)
MIYAAASLVVLTSTVGCGMINRADVSGTVDDAQLASAVQPTPAAVATPGTSRPTARQATVKVDSIAESLSLDGLVAVQQEVPVTYSGSGKLQDVKVKAGQSVNEGDELLEMDSVELGRALDAARAREQSAKANLAQAQAQQAAQARANAQRAAQQQQQQQQAVLDAQAGLRKAQDQLAAVMAGATEFDRHAAENTVTSAQTALSKAQAAQDKLNGGPDASVVRAATADVNTARIAADKAKADLDALLKGADPLALSAAQREVDRANAQLQLAQTAKLDPKVDPTAAKISHDGAIADAQLAVQTAQDKLARLKLPPADLDVQTARQRVQATQDALTAANDKLATLQQPPDQAVVDAAQQSVDLAQQSVDDAQKRLDMLNAGPSRPAINDAQDAVRRAQAALDAARNPIQVSSDPGGVDLGALQDAINQADADIGSLQQLIENTRLLAPITGTIVAVRAKPGDQVTSARPVVIMAKPGVSLVRVQLSDAEASRVVSGQKANVTLATDGPTSPPLTASVVNVTPAKNGAAPTADFQVDWGEAGPPIVGMPVEVSVIVQEKPSALVVPKAALRQAGTRSFVEVLDGTLRKITNVQVGITASDQVEIVSGLNAGQVVLLSS